MARYQSDWVKGNASQMDALWADRVFTHAYHLYLAHFTNPHQSSRCPWPGQQGHCCCRWDSWWQVLAGFEGLGQASCGPATGTVRIYLIGLVGVTVFLLLLTLVFIDCCLRVRGVWILLFGVVYYWFYLNFKTH